MKLFFIHLLLFTFTLNKSGGSCNTIDDPNAEVCVSNKAKT